MVSTEPWWVNSISTPSCLANSSIIGTSERFSVPVTRRKVRRESVPPLSHLANDRIRKTASTDARQPFTSHRVRAGAGRVEATRSATVRVPPFIDDSLQYRTLRWRAPDRAELPVGAVVRTKAISFHSDDPADHVFPVDH